MISFLLVQYVTSTFSNELYSTAELKDDFLNENIDVALL